MADEKKCAHQIFTKNYENSLILSELITLFKISRIFIYFSTYFRLLMKILQRISNSG